jgi:hypothetical protein
MMRKVHDFFTGYSLISIANKCYNRKKSPLEELFHRDSVRGCMKRIALNNTRNILIRWIAIIQRSGFNTPLNSSCIYDDKKIG